MTFSHLLKGIPVRNKIRDDLKDEIVLLMEKHGVRPCLAIVQVGDNPRSDVYVKKKEEFAAYIGADVRHMRLPVGVSFAEVEQVVKAAASDSTVHGILIQMPLPEQFSKADTQALMDMIPVFKDVDGLTTENIELIAQDFEKAIIPATARAVNLLIDGYNLPVDGKKVVMVGRSNLVGRPTALSLSHRGANVVICHSETEDVPGEARRADILITATGVPNLIGEDCVNANQVVIDIGITVIKDEKTGHDKIVGDVDFDKVSPLVSYISPVPGGVGPLTVAGLFLNLLECYVRSFWQK